MGITCEEVWRDISDYVDDELDSKQRTALEEHFAECRRCTAVLEGTFNVIRLCPGLDTKLRGVLPIRMRLRDK